MGRPFQIVVVFQHEDEVEVRRPVTEALVGSATLRTYRTDVTAANSWRTFSRSLEDRAQGSRAGGHGRELTAGGHCARPRGPIPKEDAGARRWWVHIFACFAERYALRATVRRPETRDGDPRPWMRREGRSEGGTVTPNAEVSMKHLILLVSLVFVATFPTGCTESPPHENADSKAQASTPAPGEPTLDDLRQALGRFRDVDVALAEGYIRDPDDHCVTANDVGLPAEAGAMGVHYLRPDLPRRGLRLDGR
jgi:hypothetical protein